MGAPIPGRIPWAVIRNWSNEHDYDEADAELLDVVMGEMDRVFIDDYLARVPKSGGKGERG